MVVDAEGEAFCVGGAREFFMDDADRPRVPFGARNADRAFRRGKAELPDLRRRLRRDAGREGCAEG